MQRQSTNSTQHSQRTQNHEVGGDQEDRQLNAMWGLDSGLDKECQGGNWQTKLNLQINYSTTSVELWSPKMLALEKAK